MTMKKIYISVIRRYMVIVFTLAVALAQHSCNLNNEWDEYYNNPPDRSDDYLIALIGENENYSRFYDALLEYGYDDLLSKNQYLTVFIPPNSAFEGLPEYSSEEWNKIIGFHIIYTNLYSRDFDDLDLL